MTSQKYLNIFLGMTDIPNKVFYIAIQIMPIQVYASCLSWLISEYACANKQCLQFSGESTNKQLSLNA